MQDFSDQRFWQHLDALLAASALIIDRPAGTAHPRYPDFIYPLDYGYLENTRSLDGGGIDVWVGSRPDRAFTALLCTVDLEKRDSEIKLLLGCTPSEIEEILSIHNTGPQAALLLFRQTQI